MTDKRCSKDIIYVKIFENQVWNVNIFFFAFFFNNTILKEIKKKS